MPGFSEGERLKKLGKRSKDWTPVLRAAGSLLVAAAQRAFRDQKRGKVKWLPRAVPNRAGILADVIAGRGVPQRRFEPRPAGVDTGRLRGSITYRVVGQAEVRVGTNVPYAKKIQEGGTTTLRLTKDARPALAKLLRRRKDLREPMGFLFTTKKLEIDVPPRPFITVEREDLRAIQKLVKEHVK